MMLFASGFRGISGKGEPIRDEQGVSAIEHEFALDCGDGLIEVWGWVSHGSKRGSCFDGGDFECL